MILPINKKIKKMKKFNHLKTLLLIAVITFFGCQEDEYSFGEIVVPSNIQINSEIVGVDADNPDGDGTGVVNFTAFAENAVSYKYIVNGAETLSLSGNATINFSVLGLNTYTVTVVVSGTAGVTSSKSIAIDVLSTYAAPEDLIAKLYGYDAENPDMPSAQTWKIQSAKPGHFGLGPVGGGTLAEWYSAGPNEKEGVGMYDDRFTFSSDGTYTHMTNGTVFGRNPYIVNDLGATSIGASGADIENYEYADYTASWMLTAPAGVETISLSSAAFIGYYTGGNHKYEIFDRDTPGELILKTTDANSEFDWWFILVIEE
jgi:hypothetical protein